jgi:hypothetical protein
MTGSFVQRTLRATLTLPQGNFPGTDNNTLVLTGLRMSAQLEATGNNTNSCDLRIWGMRQADMSAVTTVFVNVDGVPYDPAAQALIQLSVPSSTNGSGAYTVFTGQFYEASPDFRAAPDVCLHASALTGYSAQLTTPAPLSFTGSIDAVQVATQLAQAMGFTLEPNGAQARLNAPYLSGSLMEQFQSVVEAAGLDFYFGPDGKAIFLCPRNTGRQGKVPIPVNPQTGLVSYPTLQRYGIEVTVLFNPGIELGAPIQVSGSQVTGCDGTWFPFAMSHELESIKTNGKWFSTLQCMPFQGSA